MESVIKTIETYNLFNKGEKIAVATSGGKDSMCLLHFLHKNNDKFGIEVLAINVDHQIRENSASDSKFVEDFCKQNGITCYALKVDVPKFITENKMTLEEGARVARYKLFDAMLEKGLFDKIAIAHHQSDQVETVLLNIFRGAGLKGASGMNEISGKYIRPLLNTSKTEILTYIKENNIQFVEDETNADVNYSRNFLRNEILPKLKERWKNIEANILNFSKICKQDDNYINKSISFDDILIYDKTARIPLYKFASADSIQTRILKWTFEKLGLSKDIEKRHLNILKKFASNGQNGTKLNLPNKLTATLEYDELVLSVKQAKKEFVPKDFKLGKTIFDNFVVTIKKTNKFNVDDENTHYIDVKKLPSDVKWRTRQNGDVFTKFGSGEKKLKDYFIDKKIPASKRDNIPLLASGSEIYCVLGYEISDKVKIEQNSKYAYKIEYTKK